MFPVFHLSGESRRRMLQTALRFPYVFKARAEDSHKGTFGTLAVVGGSAGMSGAPVLAASAAMYLGCGKVWAGFNQDALPFAVIAGFPEIMLDTADGLSKRQDINAWVVGCGLGTGRAAVGTLAGRGNFRRNRGFKGAQNIGCRVRYGNLCQRKWQRGIGNGGQWRRIGRHHRQSARTGRAGF